MFNRQSKAETARALAQSAAIDRSQAVIEFKLDGTIITANHFFLDGVGGLVVLGLGWLIALGVDRVRQAVR